MKSPQKFNLLVSILLMAVLFSSCGNSYKDRQFAPLILDEAKLLSDETKGWLKNYKYPQGFVFAVRTVDTIPKSMIGVKADDLFKADIKLHSDPKAFKKRGVYLLVSKNPPLIQVRAGESIYLQTRWGGITSGKKYIEKQLLASQGNLTDAIKEMVKWTSSDLPQAVDIPWYKKWILQDIIQNLYSEIDELGLPSESFYGKYLLAPILKTRIVELKWFNSWWITYALVAAIFYLSKLLFSWIVVNPITKSTSPKVGNTIRLVYSIVVGIGLTIPSATSAIILSGSRLEDQIALKASGFSGIENIAFHPELYNESTSIWIALLLILLRIIKGLGERNNILGFALLPNSQQQYIYGKLEEENPIGAFGLKMMGTRIGKTIDVSEEDFLEEPYTIAYLTPLVDDVKAGIRWGLLGWLFLPKALSLAALYFWLVPIGTGLLMSIITIIAWIRSK